MLIVLFIVLLIFYFLSILQFIIKQVARCHPMLFGTWLNVNKALHDGTWLNVKMPLHDVRHLLNVNTVQVE